MAFKFVCIVQQDIYSTHILMVFLVIASVLSQNGYSKYVFYVVLPLIFMVDCFPNIKITFGVPKVIPLQVVVKVFSSISMLTISSGYKMLLVNNPSIRLIEFVKAIRYTWYAKSTINLPLFWSINMLVSDFNTV